MLRAVYERGLEGEGTTPAETRSDQLQTTEQDTDVIYAGLGRLTTEVAPRTAPIFLLIEEAAAGDPEMAGLLEELESQRLRRMTQVAENLRRGGHLRDDATVGSAADIMWLYTSPRVFELLVLKRGWSVERFGTFVGETLNNALAPTV